MIIFRIWDMGDEDILMSESGHIYSVYWETTGTDRHFRVIS